MMTKLNFIKKHSDSIGSTLSFMCLIHCLILPVLIATAPFFVFLSFMKTPIAEFIMITLAVLNSLIATTSGFSKHQNYIAPTLLISGSILLILHYFLHDYIKATEYFIVLGVFIIGTGHILNKKLCKKCTKCRFQTAVEDAVKHE